MSQIYVKKTERALLFKRGDYIKCLIPGKHRIPRFGQYTTLVMDISKPFEVPGCNINLLLKDDELRSELAVITLNDNDGVIHMVDGAVDSFLSKPGSYAFWKEIERHEFIKADISNPEISADIPESVYTNSKLTPYLYSLQVAAHEAGIVYFNGVLHKVYAPGKYWFWKGPTNVSAATYDLRRQQIDMVGQEIITEDKVALRLNFVCHYKIVDVVRISQIKEYQEQLYILLQLILREYIGSIRLDDLLLKKQEIAAYTLEALNAKQADFGVEFLFAGVKDIILPGDVKEILNTVLIAEKKALANVITRREETASTRSLLNTAKLMDENETLYKLKELEYLERICDKVGIISVNGSNGLLEQLNTLLSLKGKQ